MKKDVLKKIAAALLFIGTLTVSTTTLHAVTQISRSEKQFINTITTKLEGFVKFTTDWTDKFFNKANQESYNVHVDRMKTKLAEFEREIANPIKKCAQRSGSYGKVITITKNVITKLHTQAKEVYNILDRHRGKGAFKLGLAFRKVEKYTSRSEVNKLKNQLKEIQGLLTQIDPVLGKKITAIIAQVERQIQKNDARSHWTAFNALKHRIACKGAAIIPARTVATTIVANATPREIRQAAIAAKRIARKKVNAQRRAAKARAQRTRAQGRVR